MTKLSVVLVFCALVSGCTSKEQQRYAEYLPAARTCIASLEQMKPFTRADVGNEKWNAALAQVKSEVTKMKAGFSDEAGLSSYKAILEASRLYSVARSSSPTATSAEPTPDDNKGDTVGDVYINDAERDNALMLGAYKITDAKTALDAEK